VSRCCDGVMICCWLWLFCAYSSFLENRTIGLLATEGDLIPDCSGQEEGRSLLVSSRTSHAIATVVPSVLACVYMYMLYMCVYMCMYVCVQTCTYVYICMCTGISIRMHVYTCVCICVCIFVHRL